MKRTKDTIIKECFNYEETNEKDEIQAYLDDAYDRWKEDQLDKAIEKMELKGFNDYMNREFGMHFQ